MWRILMCLIFSSSIVFAGTDNRCQTKCDSRFGIKLGTFMKTTGYSNCSDQCVSHTPNYILMNQKEKIYTGMKWQCVEYARRWLIENKQVSFSDIEYAYQIWSLKSAINLKDNSLIPWQNFKNKQSDEKPQIGDLLIYGTSLVYTGHVAIVAKVSDDKVFIAEQNYDNKPWHKDQYARVVKLQINSQGFVQLEDEGLIGWMRLSESVIK